MSIAVKALNHVGIAGRSIADHRPFYEGTLGAIYEGTQAIPDQRVNAAFFRVGDVRLELLEPDAPDSPLAQFIEKRGEGLHHLAYTVANLQDRLDQLKAEGVRLIDDRPRLGAHHTQIAFMHPKACHGVLTELCEPLL